MLFSINFDNSQEKFFEFSRRVGRQLADKIGKQFVRIGIADNMSKETHNIASVLEHFKDNVSKFCVLAKNVSRVVLAAIILQDLNSEETTNHFMQQILATIQSQQLSHQNKPNL